MNQVIRQSCPHLSTLVQRIASSCAALLLLSCASIVHAADASGAGDSTLPADISGLKMDIVTLNREISALEDQLIFPSAQTSILLSIDVGSGVRLVDINLSLDDKNAAYHFYSDAESAALAKGGVHRVYAGNTTSGPHEIKAIVNGYDSQGKSFQRTINYQFTKSAKREVVEIRAGDNATKTQAEFRFKEWDIH